MAISRKARESLNRSFAADVRDGYMRPDGTIVMCQCNRCNGRRSLSICPINGRDAKEHQPAQSGCLCGRKWDDDYDCCESRAGIERAKNHNATANGHDDGAERTFPI